MVSISGVNAPSTCRKLFVGSHENFRDGKIHNSFVVDPSKMHDKFPNRMIDVSKTPWLAYYSPEGLIRGPLSEL